jgi:hypothetical protein
MRNSTIVRTGRALLCTLQPFTGERAVGVLRMRAVPGKQFTVPRFTYVFPVLNGSAHAAWLFKVDVGPEEDESWIIRGDRDTLVHVYSAIGGSRYNIPKDTTFVFDYVIPELDGSLVSDGDFTGGQNHQEEFSSLHDAVAYETFDGPLIDLDNRRSGLTHFPSAVVAFMDLTPADGVTVAQTQGGSVNAGTGSKFYKINYMISVVASRVDGDVSRRLQASLLVDDILSELVDLHMTNDGEPISNPGGIQIRQVIRDNGTQEIYKKFFIFSMLISVMTAITRTERRVFVPWLRTKMSIDHPQTPELPNQGTIRVVDSVVIDMSDHPDMTLDGTFVRASSATYWDDHLLTVYPAGERRIVGGRLLLEPDVENALGSAATDFTDWTPYSGAEVSESSTRNPAGYVGPDGGVYTVEFAPGGGGIVLPGNETAIGVPHVFTVFVRSDVALPDAIVLVSFDGVAEEETIVSIDTEWMLVRHEFNPTTTSVTLRIENALDEAHIIAVWGASFDVHARWGAEFARDKASDVLTFLPYGSDDDPPNPNRTPYEVLKGKWTVQLQTLDYVPPDLTGTGLAFAPVVVSVNDGSTDLMSISMLGTPAIGGATIMLATRGGNVLSFDSVEWIPGDLITFGIDATGELTLSGTSTHDGVYSFPRYDGHAVMGADRMVFGSDASGMRRAVPGLFSVVIGE